MQRYSSLDLQHSPIEEVFVLLEDVMKGDIPDKERVKQVYEHMKSTRDLRTPKNLQQELAHDPRLSAETSDALFSLVGTVPFAYERGSIDYRSRPSISSFPPSHVLSTAQTSWTFDSLQLTMPQPLTTLAVHLIQGENLIKKLRIDRRRLITFFSTIEATYRRVSYHNVFHACEVLQYMHMLLTAGGVKDRCRLDDQTTLACYIAALAHDMGHSGVTNDFLIKTNDDIALTYNDTSVWENFHASACIKAMRRQSCNFLQGDSNIDYATFKTSICKLILATDIKVHFQLMSLFNDIDIEQDCLPCLQMAIKCADLSHMCKKQDLHVAWVRRLEEEFLQQGDIERSRGVPVGLMMDREKPLKLSDTQVGFFEVIAMPMFRSFVATHPDALPMLEAAEQNLAMWKSKTSDAV